MSPRLVAARTDRLDQLVHCALKAPTPPLMEVDLDAFTSAINLNGTALVYLVQAARPLLKPGATVVFLSSRGSRTPLPNYAAVGAAKALAESLVRYLALELPPWACAPTASPPPRSLPKPSATSMARAPTRSCASRRLPTPAAATSPTTTTAA